MKNKIYLFAVFIVMISCSKKDDQILPETQEPGKKIQYSHDFFQEKIDSVNDPKVYSVSIIADLDKKDKLSKKIELDELELGFVAFAFTWSDYKYSDWRYLYQQASNSIWFPDPEFVDLNKGAGGAYIYLYVKVWDLWSNPINEFWVTIGEGSSDAYSCRILKNTFSPTYDAPADLNRGAGGNFIYAHARHNPYITTIIRGIGAITGNSSTIPAPPGWEKINVDLNRGAGGDWIFFIIKRGTYAKNP